MRSTYAEDNRYSNSETWGFSSRCVKDGNATGINNLIKNNNPLTVYPNPATNSFSIEINSTENQLLQVFDVTGKLIFTEVLQNGKAVINTNNLAQGVYNVCISNSVERINKRLVIVK